MGRGRQFLWALPTESSESLGPYALLANERFIVPTYASVFFTSVYTRFDNDSHK